MHVQIENNHSSTGLHSSQSLAELGEWLVGPIEPNILRASDIRGIVGEDLTEATAYTIGRAFGTVVRACGGDTVCTCMDGRLSSPSLEHALSTDLLDSGITVKRLGYGPSPMLYFGVHHLNAHGGIMVTGSHNPADYNGFKIMLGTASFHGDDIQRLGDIAASGDVANGFGQCTDVDILDDYVGTLLKAVTHKKCLSIAWDPGNGAACGPLSAALKKLPGRHIVINGELDGTFPAHHPDPTVEENLDQLKATVKERACDLGIAFDGDGDRIGVIDARGRVLWGDQLMMLYAEDVLSKYPGATVIADVKASEELFNRVSELGGRPLMWKTGHSFIKTKMVETGALLAGEMSGHIFFADEYFGFDDALYAAMRLIGILGDTDIPLEERVNNLPIVFNTPEIRFECPEHKKSRIVSRLKDNLENECAQFNDLDGVRVQTDQG